jgi:hypothetical protein
VELLPHLIFGDIASELYCFLHLISVVVIQERRLYSH